MNATRNFARLLTALIAVLVFASAAPRAASEDNVLKYVPAQHDVLIGVSARDIWDSPAVKRIQEETNFSKVDNVIANIEMFTGFNLKRDLEGVYLSNVLGRKGDHLIYFNGTFKQQDLLKIVQFNPDYAKSNYGGKEIHSWYDEKDGEKYASFLADDWLVFGETLEEVKMSVDTLTKPALAANKDLVALYKQITANASVWAIAAQSDATRPEVSNNPALKHIESAIVEINLSQNISAGMVGNLKHEEMADALVDVLNGTVKFGRLNQDHIHLQMLAENTTVERDGAQVAVRMNLKYDDVMPLVIEQLRNKGL